jgi:hypothetical protein
MARIRSIKPSIWTDERFIDLGRDARLLLIGMISHADDAGRLVASGAALIGAVYPHDDITPRQVEKWRDQIAAAGLITVYRAGRGTYCHLHGWTKHQRIQKPQPSTLPSPPNRDPVQDQSRTGSRTGSTTEWEMEWEVEWEVECGAATAAARAPSATSARTAELIDAHLAAVGSPVPDTVISDLARRIDRLLAAGTSPDQITAGLAKMRRKRLGPRLLDELIAESAPACAPAEPDPMSDPETVAWLAEQQQAAR